MANLLTGIRLLLIIPVSWGFAQPGTVNAWLMLLMLVLAIASDVLDGKIARKLGTASARGMLFDHTTDFLFVTTGLFALSTVDSVPMLLPILIVIAFTQYVLDSYFLFRQKQLRMSFLGRWNGVLYFVPLTGMAIAHLDLSATFSALLAEAVLWVAYALCISTIASIIDRALAPRRNRATSQTQSPT